MTLSGGLATAASLIVGKNSGSYGTLNLLPGGLVKTPSIAAGSGTAVFNWSGGTLQNTPANNLRSPCPLISPARHGNGR